MNEQDRYAQSVIPVGNVIAMEGGKEAPSAVIVTGISKRELFAAMLMTECMNVAAQTSDKDEELLSILFNRSAQLAVSAADILLAELAK